MYQDMKPKALHNDSVLLTTGEASAGGLGFFRIKIWKDLDQLGRTWTKRVEKRSENNLWNRGVCVCKKLEEFVSV